MKHVELKDLILAYEDLSGDEKAMADSHLAECVACRNLLAKLQEAEKDNPGWGDLPVDPGDFKAKPVAHLSPQELADAELSRLQLLDTVALETVIYGAGSSKQWGHTGFFGMALAACLALVIWSPWQNSADDVIINFRLTSQSVVRGEVADLQSGDPLVMRFNMGVDGWPVVVGISKGKKPELLFPTAIDGPFRLAAGRGIVLPPPDSATSWEVVTGTMYLVAVSQSEEPDVEQLLGLLGQVAAAESAVAHTAAILKGQFGYCEIFDSGI